MKKILLILSIILFTVPASCEQVVTIEILPTPTPRPVFHESDDLPEYDLDATEVKTLSKLLWCSPLYSDTEKTKLLWVVFNRVDAGIASSITDAVTPEEFTFYDRHSRTSDKNTDIVEREMTRWLAEKDGYHIGRRPPKDCVYCRFTGKYNRHLEILTDPYGEAVAW